MGLPVELQANEKLLQRVRRHPVFFRSQLTMLILITIIPIAIFVLLLGPVGIVLAIIWAIIMGGVIYIRRYQYVNDEWIITNQRIVDSYKRHWFHQNLASADLVNVQDMRVEKSGVMATLLDFGDLHCQTAGSRENFILKDIPKPAKVLDLIDEARDQARRSAVAPQ